MPSKEKINNDLDKIISRLEKGWTQHHSARDANGDPIGSKDEKATCWCLVGAMAKEDIHLCSETYAHILSTIRREEDAYCVGCWNDGEEQTQEKIIASLKKMKLV